MTYRYDMNLLEYYNFFFEVPLYTKIKIDKENGVEFVELMMAKGQFDAYNPILKQETTYIITKRPSDTLAPQYQKTITNYDGIKEFEIRCVRNNFTIRVFINIQITYNDEDLIESFTLTKIGQNPSIADLHISKIKQYDKILSNEKLKEFTRAIGLASNGVGIGSFVYLRRIFEGLIEEAHLSAKNDSNWDEENYKKNRIAERIELLTHHLPEFLVENKNLYSILSVGIHDLEENECLKYFDVVKVGIELILDEKVEAYNKKKKLEDAKKKIQLVGQQVTKNQ